MKVADAGEDRVGHWIDERIDLAHIYAEISRDAAPAHLVSTAVFVITRALVLTRDNWITAAV